MHLEGTLVDVSFNNFSDFRKEGEKDLEKISINNFDTDIIKYHYIQIQIQSNKRLNVNISYGKK